MSIYSHCLRFSRPQLNYHTIQKLQRSTKLLTGVTVSYDTKTRTGFPGFLINCFWIQLLQFIPTWPTYSDPTFLFWTRFTDSQPFFDTARETIQLQLDASYSLSQFTTFKLAADPPYRRSSLDFIKYARNDSRIVNRRVEPALVLALISPVEPSYSKPQNFSLLNQTFS